MCGRYALALPPSRVRRQLQDANMPSQDAPEDDDVRQTHNFAPGYYGLVYRADAPDHGVGGSQRQHAGPANNEADGDAEALPSDAQVEAEIEDDAAAKQTIEPVYKLQSMKWGLVPFWTKRNPDYGSMMRTINCRDDSLASPGGMWNSMKQKKRCIVVAQGFYEWLKKDGGKTKIPHFVKRRDGQLMCFAGLWDRVKYEDAQDSLYTYTIITTDSNQQLGFLHDRMPVILDNGSNDMFIWLDSNRSQWSKELQSLLQPFKGELECYPVSKDVGKVGNDSPTFIIPVDSTENKQNIANFFGSQKQKPAAQTAEPLKPEAANELIEMKPDEPRETTDVAQSETNAPQPVPVGTKRPISPDTMMQTPDPKAAKTNSKNNTPKMSQSTPSKQTPQSIKPSKSSTTNEPLKQTSPIKADGSKKITSFFGK